MLRKSIKGIFRRNKPLPIKKAILFSSSFFAAGLIVPLFAFAELSNDTVLGPGLRSQPAYDGSASQNVEFVPVVRYLGQPWFVRSTQGVLEGGVRMELAPGLHVGAQLAYEPLWSAFLTKGDKERIVAIDGVTGRERPNLGHALTTKVQWVRESLAPG